MVFSGFDVQGFDEDGRRDEMHRQQAGLAAH